MKFFIAAVLGLMLIALSGRAIAAQEAQVGDKWTAVDASSTVTESSRRLMIDGYYAPQRKRHRRVRRNVSRQIAGARGEARVVSTSEAPPMVDSIVSLLREQSCVDVQAMAWNKAIDVAIDRWMTERHLWQRSDAKGRPNPAK